MGNIIQLSGQPPPVCATQGKPTHNNREAVDDDNSFKEVLKTEKKKKEEEVDESLAGVVQIVCASSQTPIEVVTCESSAGSVEAPKTTMSLTEPVGLCGEVLPDVNPKAASAAKSEILSGDVSNGQVSDPVQETDKSVLEQALAQMVRMSETSSAVNPDMVIDDSQKEISDAVISSVADPEIVAETSDGKVENLAQAPVKNAGEQAVGTEFGKVFLDTGKVLQTESVQVASVPEMAADADVTNVKPVEASQQSRLPVNTPEDVKHSSQAAFENDEASSGKRKISTSDNQSITSIIGATGETSSLVGKMSEAGEHRIQLTSQNLQEIARAIELSQQTGKTFVRIHLNPQDLGMIDIRLSSSSSGVGVSILTEHSSTGRLLEAQMEQLRQTLGDAGIQLTNMDIGSRGQGQQEQGKSMNTQHQSLNQGADRSLLQKRELELNHRREISSQDLATTSRLIDCRV